MFRTNPILEGIQSVSLNMLNDTARLLRNAKAKLAYHTTMCNMFGKKLAEISEKEGALADRVVQSSLMKSQNYHSKKMGACSELIDELTNRLNDIKYSMGYVK